MTKVVKQGRMCRRVTSTLQHIDFAWAESWVDGWRRYTILICDLHQFDFKHLLQTCFFIFD